MEHGNYGSYECVSQEKDYTKVVKKYHLEKQVIPTKRNFAENVPTEKNNVPAVTLHTVWITLGLSVAVLEFFR